MDFYWDAHNTLAMTLQTLIDREVVHGAPLSDYRTPKSITISKGNRQITLEVEKETFLVKTIPLNVLAHFRDSQGHVQVLFRKIDVRTSHSEQPPVIHMMGLMSHGVETAALTKPGKAIPKSASDVYGVTWRPNTEEFEFSPGSFLGSKLVPSPQFHPFNEHESAMVQSISNTLNSMGAKHEVWYPDNQRRTNRKPGSQNSFGP